MWTPCVTLLWIVAAQSVGELESSPPAEPTAPTAPSLDERVEPVEDAHPEEPPEDAEPSASEEPAPSAAPPPATVGAPIPEAPPHSETVEPPAVTPEATEEAEPPPADPSTSEIELTDEEMAELLGAIGADAAEGNEGEAGSSSSTPVGPLPGFSPTGSGAVGRALSNMNPEMAFILDVAGAWFSPGLSFRGQPGSSGVENYQGGAHDPSRTGFNLQQLELHVSADVDPLFHFEGNLVFGQFGVEVEEAYASTLALPFGVQARVGQFLTRFGRLNPTHPHQWHFADQPLVNGKFFGAEGSRGLGLEVSWLAPLPWYVELIGSLNEAGNACCARSYYGGAALETFTPLDVLGTAALKQFFPLGDDLSLSWGLSGQSGPNPSGKWARTEIVGTDLYLRWRPVDSPGRTSLSWTTEAMVRRYQIPGSVLMDAGFSSQLVLQLQLQYEVGLRVEGVSGSPGDPLDPDWSGLRSRISAQGTFYPSHFSRLRAQVAYGASGAWDVAIWEQLIDRPVFSVFVAFEFLIGAHGSHGF